jgi:predicted NBD/HSP70 family sugar kinase
MAFHGSARQLRGTNATAVRVHNRSIVIRALLRQGPLSRQALAHLTGLMPSTITYVVAELIAAGLVQELGPDPAAIVRVGGRPILVDIRQDGACALAIEIGENFVRAGLVDLKAGVRHVGTVALAQGTAPETVAGLVGQLASQARARLGSSWLIGVGVATPGLVHPQTGVNEFAAFHGWHDVPLADLISTAAGAPAHIQNNARAMALAEHWYGAARLVDDLLSITVTEGIGSGIIIGGRVYSGWSGLAGEIGHTVVIENGPLCACGKCGCLEAIASTHAIARRARAAWGTIAPDATRGMAPFPADSPSDAQLARQVLTAAAAGDRAALAIIAEPIHHLALAVANLTVVFDPQLVVLSGDVLPVVHLIVRAINEAIAVVSLLPAERRPQVVPTMLGADAGLIGAATLVFDRVLDHGDLLAAEGGFGTHRAATGMQ